MLFIKALSLTAALALHTSVSLGAPTDPSPTTSPNDYIYKNLAAAGKLNWTPSNGGHIASIAQEDWNAAKKKGTPTKRSANPGKGGDIGGLTVDMVCYGSGAVMEDTLIASFAIQACNALIASIPAPVVPAYKGLQIWQSSDVAEVNGHNGYLRFSYELLNAIAANSPPDISICQAAMNEFNNFCQDDNGDTRGGEATVGGGSYKFDVDPTDDASGF